MLEKEIQKINKVIDLKIMRGEDYRREARDHKLMIRRMRYYNQPTLLRRFFPTFLSV